MLATRFKLRLFPPCTLPYARHLYRAIGSFIQGDDSIKVTWKSIPNTETEYHYVWLRDNCPCPQCFSPERSLRHLHPLSLTTDIKPISISQRSNHSLSISWSDGHQSDFTADWLKKYAYDGSIDTARDKRVPFTRDERQDPILWGEEISSNPPRMIYQEIMERDEKFLEWNSLMELHGFCLVDETPLDIESMRNLFNRIGIVRNTIWGDFYVLGKGKEGVKAGSATRDPSLDKTSTPIIPHLDGSYWLVEGPALQLLQPLSFTGKELPINILTDGFKVAEKVREESEYHYQLLTRVPFPYQYEDDVRKHYSSHCFFKVQPHTGKLIGIHNSNIRRMVTNKYCYYELKEFDPNATMVDLYKAMDLFHEVLYTDHLSYKFQLKIGTALITDNHRVFHARTAYEGERALRGAYMNLEDWRARVIAVKDRLAAAK